MAVMEPTDWRSWVITRPGLEPDSEASTPAEDTLPTAPDDPGILFEAAARPATMDLAGQRALLNHWANQSRIAQFEHALAAREYSRLSRVLGVPAVAAATFVAASVLTSIAEHGTLDAWAKVMVGVISAAGAVLSTLQTLLNHGGTGSLHQEYWAEYECILRRVEMLRGELPSGTHIAPIEAESAVRYLTGRLRELEEHIERIDRSAPTVPARCRHAARRRADLSRARAYWHSVRFRQPK